MTRIPPRRPSFPKLKLSRIRASESIVIPDVFKKSNPGSNYHVYLDEHNQAINALFENFPESIIERYGHYNNVEHLITPLPHWDTLHCKLSVILANAEDVESIYNQYQAIKKRRIEESSATKSEDTSFVNLAKFEDVDIFGYWFAMCHDDIALNVLNILPEELRIPLWHKLVRDLAQKEDFMRINSLREGDYYFTASISDISVIPAFKQLMVELPKSSFAVAIDILPWLYKKFAQYPTRGWESYTYHYEFIDSILAVPYVLDDFNKRYRRERACLFLQHLPDTFYNELVYLLFTKPVFTKREVSTIDKDSKDWIKKAHRNAKKALDYMLDNNSEQHNYLENLQQAINRFDGNQTTINDFIKKYTTAHTHIKQEKKTKAQTEEDINIAPLKMVQMATPDAITTNEDGIPQALLNTDWQKQTRKRKFPLEDTIYQQIAVVNGAITNAGAQVPILEALSAPILIATGQPLPEDAFKQLLLMLKFSPLQRPISELLTVLSALTADSLTRLGDALWHDFMTNTVDASYGRNFDKDKKWFLTAQAWLADENFSETVWQLIKNFESHPYARSTLKHSFEVLAAQASSHPKTARADTALAMLVKISQKARSSLRPPAEKALETYLAASNLSVDELAERLLPTFGLDEQGEKTIDYQPNASDSRQITISLTPALTFVYHDETGKTYKNPPKARQVDDAQTVQDFLTAHKAERKQLREFATDLPKRLEQRMILGRSQPLPDFTTYYVNNPIMRPLTQRLLWQLNTGDSQILFRVSESLELLDADDNLLPEHLIDAQDATVTLPHPINMTQAAIKQWAEVFSDYELIQPFAQLLRPVYLLSEEERLAGVTHRFDNERFAMGSLIGLGNANKGWQAYQLSGGHCDGFSKEVNGHVLDIAIIDNFLLGEPARDDDKGRRIEPLHLPKDIDALTASEFILTVDDMARMG